MKVTRVKQIRTTSNTEKDKKKQQKKKQCLCDKSKLMFEINKIIMQDKNGFPT